MRWRGLEPPRPIQATRPSTLRVYQFRHQRVRCDPEVYRLAAAARPGVRPRIGSRDLGVTLSSRGLTPPHAASVLKAGPAGRYPLQAHDLPDLRRPECRHRQVLHGVRRGRSTRAARRAGRRTGRASASAPSAARRSRPRRPRLPSGDAPAAHLGEVAERRLVTVLFADLVGFTTLSERRDAEEVRDLLSRYFATCRRLIGLYGGTVEKFIGDAVMAVWGTPTATEDDAERAVRAALDLVAAISSLGEELGAEGLRARVGVLTGEAAVTIGAQGEGMVAGDLVNTASRIQSVAEPGAVFIGDATRRATEQTIVYEPAGSFELKGKDGLVTLWRALRVISGARGALKSQGLEAPFVGRDRELRLIKDLFHACADEHTAHLVSVTGVAGIGKSRLAWEFYKYFDGLAEIVYWHRGRCLAYGEGVTYWALADMVRMRCRIGEDESAETAAGEAARDARGAHPRRRRAPVRRAAPGAARRARRPGGARPQGALRGVAALLRAAVGHVPDRARLRGHAVGRRVAPRLHRGAARPVALAPDLRRRAGPAGAARAPRRRGAPAFATSRRSTSSRSRRRRCRTSCSGSSRGSRPRFASRSWPGPRASRSMPSRRCGCCSTAETSCWRAPPTGRWARSARWRCPRRCTR